MIRESAPQKGSFIIDNFSGRRGGIPVQCGVPVEFAVTGISIPKVCLPPGELIETEDPLRPDDAARDSADEY